MLALLWYGRPCSAAKLSVNYRLVGIEFYDRCCWFGIVGKADLQSDVYSATSFRLQLGRKALTPEYVLECQRYNFLFPSINTISMFEFPLLVPANYLLWLLNVLSSTTLVDVTSYFSIAIVYIDV